MIERETVGALDIKYDEHSHRPSDVVSLLMVILTFHSNYNRLDSDSTARAHTGKLPAFGVLTPNCP